MADKPAQLCQLQKGVYLGAQEGFVDTFNWAVQAIANLEGGENCAVKWDLPDHPTIDVTPHEDEIGGGGGGGDITIIGTYGSATSQDGELVFAAASDTNIQMSCSGNTVTFGVYYI